LDYEQILYEVEDGILTLTLHRPEKLNAFTEKMGAEMAKAFDRADADDNIRVIVVTGAGKGFCAGADLSQRGTRTFDYSARPERPPEAGPRRDGGGLLSLRIFKLKKPVIAAINGAAVGVGITMALPMDIRLASTEAKIGFVFSRRGIVLEACSNWFLPRIVGMSKALEWAMSGRIFPAVEAHEAGLVRSLHPPEELLPAAYAIAREIAANTSAISVALNRHMLWRLSAAEHPMFAHRIETLAIQATGQSADAAEGVKSFLEKRPARFPDKTSTNMPGFFPWWEEPKFQTSE